MVVAPEKVATIPEIKVEPLAKQEVKKETVSTPTTKSNNDYSNFKEMEECVKWTQDVNSVARKIYNAFKKYGKENAMKMTCICKQESQHRNIRSYIIGANGYWDYGVCQINGVHHKEIIKRCGCQNWSEKIQNDVDLNIQLAEHVFNNRGNTFGAWYANTVRNPNKTIKYYVTNIDFSKVNI